MTERRGGLSAGSPHRPEIVDQQYTHHLKDAISENRRRESVDRPWKLKMTSSTPPPREAEGATVNMRSCAGCGEIVSVHPRTSLILPWVRPSLVLNCYGREIWCKKGTTSSASPQNPLVLSLKRDDIEVTDCIREITHVSGVMCARRR